MKYTQYINNEFRFSFEYPSEWKMKLRQYKMDLYNNGIIITIIGPPESKTGIGYTALNLWVISTKERTGKISTLDEYVEKSLKQNSIGPYKVLSNIESQMADLHARELTILYETYRPSRLPRKAQTLVISIKKWIIVEKGDYFYDLLFVSSADDYPKYIEEYEHAKKTFKFIGD